MVNYVQVGVKFDFVGIYLEGAQIKCLSEWTNI